MHELSLTQSIVATCERHAEGQPVKRVMLKVGRLAGVELDALRFCFGVCSEQTLLREATLEIEEIPGLGECQQCHQRVDMDRLIAVCPCEKRARLRLVAGDEFMIQAIEV